MDRSYDFSIETLLDSVRAAVETQNWLAGLALTLTLPDICASIEDPKKKRRYSEWWNDNFGESYRYGKGQKDYVTGVEVYLLRCAYLHQGSDSSDPDKVEQYEATIGRFNFVLSSNPSFPFENLRNSRATGCSRVLSGHVFTR